MSSIATRATLGVALVCLLSAGLAAEASAGTYARGVVDTNGALVIDPLSAGEGELDAVRTIQQQEPIGVFIERMPIDKTIDSVVLGGLATPAECSVRTPARITIMRHDDGGEALSGQTTLIAWSTPVLLPFGEPGEMVFSFAGSTPTLAQGQSYSFTLTWMGEGCPKARVRTWAHNRRVVNGGRDRCVKNPLIVRMWHEEGVADAQTDCISPAVGFNWDPSMPTGWLIVNEAQNWIYTFPRQASQPPVNDACRTWSPSMPDLPLAFGAELALWRQTPNEPWLNDWVCRWTSFGDLGEAVDDGWYYATPWDTARGGAAADMYMCLDTVVADDCTAQNFRPILKFDENEKWRPLSIGQFLSEQFAGQPYNRVCATGGTCNGLTGSQDLRPYPSTPGSPTVIELGTRAQIDDEDGTEYRSPNDGCVDDGPSGPRLGRLLDCNGGALTSIYYRATLASDSYDYLQYWWFYRYNYTSQFGDGNHEGDWEGIVVAYTSPTTFDFVGFRQHNYGPQYYTRETMACDDGGSNSCGGGTAPASGRRVWVYPAEGTHASYPISCTSDCAQNNPFLSENEHGGQVDWGRNDDPVGVISFPPAVGWGNPAVANWTDWTGGWGRGGGVRSPGDRPEYRCPWQGNPNDSTSTSGCAASRRRESLDASASRCSNWTGGSVVVSACSPTLLGRAVRAQTVGKGGGFRLRPVRVQKQRKAGAARGVAQLVGSPLVPGDRVSLTGEFPRDLALTIRAVAGKRLATWQSSGGVPRRGRLTITVRSADGVPVISVRAQSGARLRASRRELSVIRMP